MEIKTNPFFYKSEDEVVYVEDGEDAAETSLIAGMITDDAIYILRQMHFLEWVSTLTHEMGHFIGDRISFRDGSVLRPNDILDQFIEFTDSEFKLLKQEIEDIADPEAIKRTHIEIEILIGLCFKLVRVFLNDTDAGLEDIKLYICEPEEIVAILRDPESGAMLHDGKVVGQNDRQGRNDELPSVFVEIACMLILENSLKRERLLDQGDNIEVPLKSFPHQRAQNIVFRGFQNNYAIPSLVDLNPIDEDSSQEVEA